MTEASKEDDVVLNWVLSTHYPLHFCKDKENQVLTLINSSDEINAMISAYVSKLGLRVCRTNVKAQKIDSSTLKTFGIILASFQVEDKFRNTWFF